MLFPRLEDFFWVHTYLFVLEKRCALFGYGVFDCLHTWYAPVHSLVFQEPMKQELPTFCWLLPTLLYTTSSFLVTTEAVRVS